MTRSFLTIECSSKDIEVWRPPGNETVMTTVYWSASWRMFVLLLAEGLGSKGEQSVDGGIPLTLGISCLIFFVGFLILLFIRNDMYYMYCPRIWSKGLVLLLSLCLLLTLIQ